MLDSRKFITTDEFVRHTNQGCWNQNSMISVVLCGLPCSDWFWNISIYGTNVELNVKYPCGNALRLGMGDSTVACSAEYICNGQCKHNINWKIWIGDEISYFGTKKHNLIWHCCRKCITTADVVNNLMPWCHDKTFWTISRPSSLPSFW